MSAWISEERLQDLQDSLGYQFTDSKWLVRALCHKSFNKENLAQEHNEKLEFLGDAVLDVVLSDLLMEKFAEDTEGSLSRKRASIVNEDRLSQLALTLNIPTYLLIGQREMNNQLSENPRIVASALEAVVGGIYKDRGFLEAYAWVEKLFAPVLDEAFTEHDFASDYKTRFQEKMQEEYKQTPRYKVVNSRGPDHSCEFEVEIFVGEESWGKAWGSSKKSAAQNAAKQALERVSE